MKDNAIHQQKLVLDQTNVVSGSELVIEEQ
jgi:hypothetical protein